MFHQHVFVILLWGMLMSPLRPVRLWSKKYFKIHYHLYTVVQLASITKILPYGLHAYLRNHKVGESPSK